MLSACQSAGFSYAYFNDRKDTVTIVEHGGRDVHISTLEPGVRLFSKDGESFPDSVEVFDPKQRRVGVLTLNDYKSHPSDVPAMLVVSRTGVAFASRALLDKLYREWEPSGHPSHHVSFAGGDGSSTEKAIIVHAQDGRDEGAAHSTYMRTHFGYRSRTGAHGSVLC